MVARGGAVVGGGFVATECLVLLLIFFSIYSNPSFHMHFYKCFFMLPLAAPCRTKSKWRFCDDRMLVFVKKVKSTNRIVSDLLGVLGATLE